MLRQQFHSPLVAWEIMVLVPGLRILQTVLRATIQFGRLATSQRKSMTLKLNSLETFWANKRRRMADVYALNGFVAVPVLLGAKGNLVLIVIAWLIVAIACFLTPLPFIKRFKVAFGDFEKRFWLAQITGLFTVLLLMTFPDWRGVIGLCWGVAVLILILPLVRKMKPNEPGS